MTTLHLPYPPSVNHYYARTVHGGVMVGKRGRAYRTEVALLVRTSGAKPIAGDVVLDVAVHPPDKRKRDLDNVLKCLLDALQAGDLYADDNQVSRIHIARHDPVSGGRVEVCAYPRVFGELAKRGNPRKRSRAQALDTS